MRLAATPPTGFPRHPPDLAEASFRGRGGAVAEAMIRPRGGGSRDHRRRTAVPEEEEKAVEATPVFGDAIPVTAVFASRRWRGGARLGGGRGAVAAPFVSVLDITVSRSSRRRHADACCCCPRARRPFPRRTCCSRPRATHARASFSSALRRLAAATTATAAGAHAGSPRRPPPPSPSTSARSPLDASTVRNELPLEDTMVATRARSPFLQDDHVALDPVHQLVECLPTQPLHRGRPTDAAGSCHFAACRRHECHQHRRHRGSKDVPRAQRRGLGDKRDASMKHGWRPGGARNNARAAAIAAGVAASTTTAGGHACVSPASPRFPSHAIPGRATVAPASVHCSPTLGRDPQRTRRRRWPVLAQPLSRPGQRSVAAGFFVGFLLGRRHLRLRLRSRRLLLGRWRLRLRLRSGRLLLGRGASRPTSTRGLGLGRGRRAAAGGGGFFATRPRLAGASSPVFSGARSSSPASISSPASSPVSCVRSTACFLRPRRAPAATITSSSSSSSSSVCLCVVLVELRGEESRWISSSSSSARAGRGWPEVVFVLSIDVFVAVGCSGSSSSWMGDAPASGVYAEAACCRLRSRARTPAYGDARAVVDGPRLGRRRGDDGVSRRAPA